MDNGNSHHSIVISLLKNVPFALCSKNYPIFPHCRSSLLWIRGALCAFNPHDGTLLKAGGWFRSTYSLNPCPPPSTPVKQKCNSINIFSKLSSVTSVTYYNIIMKYVFSELNCWKTIFLAYFLNPVLMIPCPTDQEWSRAFGGKSLCGRDPAFAMSSSRAWAPEYLNSSKAF